MRSPFKFLDPFTLPDKKAFFGRKKETKQLYRQVLRTRLLLLYGLSGTGKTSLIQCGLAGEFDGPDWLPLWIRHQANINESLQSVIRRLLPDAEGSIPEQIRQLYQHYLRPVYLIFDQFEELYILGNKDERKKFESTLKAIMADDLPCTVLLVIREEYLGRLYQLEKAIPGLFDFRMRVEPMDTTNVKNVLRESFREFNISVEGNEDDRFEEMIRNVSRERFGIELPYLQVYLDQLYRQDFDRTYPACAILPEGTLPPLEFTKQEIEDFGTIDKVLFRFLTEQKQLIQAQIKEKDSTTPVDAVKLVLDGFVSEEGTKRPVRYIRQEGIVAISPAQQGFFPVLPASTLTLCLLELERAKILRSEDEYIELAHDSLAAIINEERSDKQRERNNIKSQIRLALANFQTSQEYLTPKQLIRFEDVLPELNMEEREFYEDSEKVREGEANKELEKEKEQAYKSRIGLIFAVVGCVIACVGAVVAYSLYQNAEVAIELAKRNLAIADSTGKANDRIINAFYFYNNRFAIAQKLIEGKKKYGFINKNGDPVIDYEFDEATQFSDVDGFARVKQEGKIYLLDTLANQYLLATSVNEITEETTALDLSSKELNSIPITIFNWPKIKVLLLLDNSIKHIPKQIIKLESLTMLDLRANQLTSLPPEIGQLKNLTTLYLSFNSQFTDLPPEIGQLKSLTTLYLRENSLTSIPPQIGQLKSLTKLYLRENQLTSLPPQIGQLKSLTTLDLRKNKILFLPPQIEKLTSLTALGLSGNPIPETTKSEIKKLLPWVQIYF